MVCYPCERSCSYFNVIIFILFHAMLNKFLNYKRFPGSQIFLFDPKKKENSDINFFSELMNIDGGFQFVLL